MVHVAAPKSGLLLPLPYRYAYIFPAPRAGFPPIPSIFFFFLLQLLPSLSSLRSTIGSCSGHTSPLPATVRAFEVYREKSSAVSSLVDVASNCAYTRWALFASQSLHKKKGPHGVSRTREIGRTSYEVKPLDHRRRQ